MQINLLSRKRWSTRIGLTSAILKWPDMFHIRPLHHSTPSMEPPIEHGMMQPTIQPVA
ncbi:hypothetical protein [Nocardia flavorosea]|uniref:Uncharacterized protein n=1 Tax=Nocardia flavorosea TaxID=53429 RepID=A0A846YHQ4_9NOCA|nr:hypothetical protein [Nocardia flavorosea]NKY58345.1 hypothetical protein [Nocardia flavorosea]